MMDYQYLLSLKTRVAMRETLSEEDGQTVFEILEKTRDLKSINLAGLILSETLPTLQKFIQAFPRYDTYKQKELIPCMACSNHVEAYSFLFHLLKTSRDNKLNLILTVCLGKTDYFVFPLLLAQLELADEEENDLYIEKLKGVLKRIGFYKLKPYLRMFPLLPHEWVFREAFGDDLINSLSEKK